MVHLLGLTMLDNVYTSRLRLAILLLALPVLAACSKSFVVTSEVPKPLIERLPVSAKLVYSNEFRDYVYVEKGDDRALEKVDFGSAQVGLFNRVFGDLLSLVEGDATPDMKIEPQILDFQYSVPAETKINMYEIWLKYRLKITDGQDAEIADWVVKGYGKTPTSMLSSHLKAFNSASNMALRDIGAQLALGFDSQPSIEDYLASKGNNIELAEEVQQTEEVNEVNDAEEIVEQLIEVQDPVALVGSDEGAENEAVEENQDDSATAQSPEVEEE